MKERITITVSESARAIIDEILRQHPHLEGNVSGAVAVALYGWQDQYAGDLLAPQEAQTMADARIFEQTDADGDTGWVVDLSEGDAVNPDCWWRFDTQDQAARFVALVDAGTDPRQASGDVTGYYA
jgi:hypothetical protein